MYFYLLKRKSRSKPATNVWFFDVLLKNRDVFAYWKQLGLLYLFLGLEALDADTLRLHRKRVTPDENMQALEVARELGLTVAINLIADPAWDEEHFRPSHGQHALSRHGDLVHRSAAADVPGLPSL